MKLINTPNEHASLNIILAQTNMTLHKGCHISIRWQSDLLSTADSLKFTFDLPLPGKRASRKGPNARKVRHLFTLLFLFLFLGGGACKHGLKGTCLSRLRSFTTTRRAAAVCRMAWKEKTARMSSSGEWGHVHLSILLMFESLILCKTGWDKKKVSFWTHRAFYF